MEEHRGFIRVKSKPGKGSTFKLYFPYQSEEDDAGMLCELGISGIYAEKIEECPECPFYQELKRTIQYINCSEEKE